MVQMLPAAMSATKEAANTMKISDPWANAYQSLAAKLAAFFHRHPNEWVDGKVLATIAGGYAWRTRVSDLRRAPFNLHIVNRQRQIEAGGALITVSEYKSVEINTEESAAAGAEDADCCV